MSCLILAAATTLGGAAVGGVSELLAATPAPAGTLSALSLLGIGLILGLKHALDADHLAAVSTLVSDRKGMLGAPLVGMLWGVGHTLALLLAGAMVILLHVEIGQRTVLFLELCVAIMLIGLGANALWKLARGGHIHLHVHQHGGRVHVHPHAHHGAAEASHETHHGLRLNARPLVVGMMHGFAGSAALMLLVLSTIPSPLLGFAYIAVFGLGSIGGMVSMSILVGLPVQLTAAHFRRANLAVRTLAGVFSVGCGLVMLYQIGLIESVLL